MSSQCKTVKHGGHVERIDGGVIYVNIVSHSACSACHAKGACGLGDVAVKVVEVKADKHPDIAIGDEVQVFISQSAGIFAVILAYMLPLALILLTLFGLDFIGVSEPVNALFSLGVAAIYYTTLYVIRDRINNKIKIDIKK